MALMDLSKGVGVKRSFGCYKPQTSSGDSYYIITALERPWWIWSVLMVPYPVVKYQRLPQSWEVDKVFCIRPFHIPICTLTKMMVYLIQLFRLSLVSNLLLVQLPPVSSLLLLKDERRKDVLQHLLLLPLIDPSTLPLVTFFSLVSLSSRHVSVIVVLLVLDFHLLIYRTFIYQFF